MVPRPVTLQYNMLRSASSTNENILLVLMLAVPSRAPGTDPPDTPPAQCRSVLVHAVPGGPPALIYLTLAPLSAAQCRPVPPNSSHASISNQWKQILRLVLNSWYPPGPRGTVPDTPPAHCCPAPRPPAQCWYTWLPPSPPAHGLGRNKSARPATPTNTNSTTDHRCSGAYTRPLFSST
jgi:hypothetical protein